MKTIQVKDYIGSLLEDQEPDISEVQNTIALYSVYIHGLLGKEFPIDILIKELKLEEEIPEIFHTLVAQSAIIKSKKTGGSNLEYLFKNVSKLSSELKGYFNNFTSK